MALQRIQFAAHSYQDESPPVSCQRLVNLYLGPQPADAKSSRVLYGTPGLSLFATCGSGPIRGMHGMGDTLYVVSGTELYRVNSAGAATLAGTITGIRHVAMADNGSQVAIVSDNDCFYASETDTGTLSVNNCIGVAYQDGYGLFAERNTQKFFISALNDFTTFDGTDFTLVNAYPDLNKGILNLNRETWVFQERSIQTYYNSGNPDFPFTRNAAGVIRRGCLAPRTVAEHQGSALWLGDDKRVYRSQGYQPIAISTAPIDRAIQGYAAPDGAVGFVYSLKHAFYVLTFREATWVCNLDTGLWHEQQSDGLDYWRATTYASHFGKHLAGDAINGKVYTLDLDTYTDAGDTIRRIATSPPIHAGRKRAFMSQVQLDIETGVGLNSGQGSDPQVMLQWTNDSGRTWSNELWRSAGAQGQYSKRVKWDRLGSFRDRSLRVQISDPVKVAILDCYVDVEVGET